MSLDLDANRCGAWARVTIFPTHKSEAKISWQLIPKGQRQGRLPLAVVRNMQMQVCAHTSHTNTSQPEN